MKAIEEHKASDKFEVALTGQEYYATTNVGIGKRMGYIERQMRGKVKVKFHRLRNGFFPFAVNKLVMYLMGNGATLDDDVKASIDKKFDNKMNNAAIDACVDGVIWGFPDEDGLQFFRIAEDKGSGGFLVLVDRRTSAPMVGIRFWQTEQDEPMNIELYEVDGITEYETNNGSLVEIVTKRPYIGLNKEDVYNGKKIPENYKPNYGILPIFPLYANKLKESELTVGLQALIDGYDFVSSDWVDATTLLEGLYGIIKNYNGQDAAQLLSEIQQLKTILIDGQDAGAELQPIEMPFESKQNLLEFLEKRMFDDFPLPNKRQVGGVTAREIEDAREDLDIKATMLEWQVAEFIENVLRLKGNDMMLPDYARRTTNNDSEIVKNISTQIDSGWIDKAMAVTLDPTIPKDDKKALIKRLGVEELEEGDETYPLKVDNDGQRS